MKAAFECPGRLPGHWRVPGLPVPDRPELRRRARASARWSSSCRARGAGRDPQVLRPGRVGHRGRGDPIHGRCAGGAVRAPGPDLRRAAGPAACSSSTARTCSARSTSTRARRTRRSRESAAGPGSSRRTGRDTAPLTAWFPPKWGLNGGDAAGGSRSAPSGRRLAVRRRRRLDRPAAWRRARCSTVSGRCLMRPAPWRANWVRRHAAAAAGESGAAGQTGGHGSPAGHTRR